MNIPEAPPINNHLTQVCNAMFEEASGKLMPLITEAAKNDQASSLMMVMTTAPLSDAHVLSSTACRMEFAGGNSPAVNAMSIMASSIAVLLHEAIGQFGSDFLDALRASTESIQENANRRDLTEGEN